jgi:hypothetical protein
MSEQIQAASTSAALRIRGLRDPLVDPKRLSRKQIMAGVRLRVDIASGNDAAIEAAKVATGPLWLSVLSVIDNQTERRRPHCWPRIAVALDLLSEMYGPLPTRYRRPKPPSPLARAPKQKPPAAVVPLKAPASAPPSAAPRVPFRLGQASR